LAVSVRYDNVYVWHCRRTRQGDKVAATLSPVLDVRPRICGRIDPKKTVAQSAQKWCASAVAEAFNSCGTGRSSTRSHSVEYPEGSLAAQVLGFVGRDFNGLGGLELSYETELAGSQASSTRRRHRRQEIVWDADCSPRRTRARPGVGARSVRTARAERLLIMLF